MSVHREQLIAYLATLGALVVCFVAALAFGALNPGVITKLEAFGLGTLVGGLIGVLRLPQQRSVEIEPANERNDK